MRTSSVVEVADNSGPCYIRIIKVLRSSSKASVKIGDHIIGSVLSVHQQKKFKVIKGSIVRAVCVRNAQSHVRKDGQRLKFQYPAVVIISRNGIPRGTKIYGPVSKELRELGYLRLVSLSTIAL